MEGHNSITKPLEGINGEAMEVDSEVRGLRCLAPLMNVQTRRARYVSAPLYAHPARSTRPLLPKPPLTETDRALQA